MRKRKVNVKAWILCLQLRRLSHRVEMGRLQMGEGQGRKVQQKELWLGWIGVGLARHKFRERRGSRDSTVNDVPLSMRARKPPSTELNDSALDLVSCLIIRMEWGTCRHRCEQQEIDSCDRDRYLEDDEWRLSEVLVITQASSWHQSRKAVCDHKATVTGVAVVHLEC